LGANGIKKQYWRSPYLEEIEFLTAEASSGTFRKHIHDYLTITIVEKGHLPFSLKEKNYFLKPGSFFISGPETLHGFDFKDRKENCQYHTLFFKKQIAKEYFNLTGKDTKPNFVIYAVTSYQLWDIFLKAIKGIKKKSIQDVNSILNISKQLSSQVSQASLLQNTNLSRNIEIAKDFIDRNYFMNLSLNEISEVCGVTYFHLIHQFKFEVGLSPYDYFLQVKINKAKQMISLGHSIISVAFDLGFVDQSHFSNTFRKILGVSPNQYLKDKL